MTKKRAKLSRRDRKPTWEIGGVKLYAETRQYVVVRGKDKVVHYCATLEEALEDMIDLFERKRLRRKSYASAKGLLRDVVKVHQEFWKEYDNVRKEVGKDGKIKS